MKRFRIYVCAFVFVALTAVKLVLPASAAQVRDALQRQLSADDDYRAAGTALLAAAKRTGSARQEPLQRYTPVLPLEQMEQERASHAHVFLSDLPGALLFPTPSPESEAELDRNVSLDAAYAAREAFLESQAAFADQTLPANVSYDIPELPFATVTPVSGYTSSGFGFRMHPIHETVKFHYGTDFAADAGTDIAAFADGTVLAAGQDAGYGNYVKLDHGSGFVTLYGHCSALLVQAGQTVTAGQTIARVGATGQATGPHLHFELIHEGVYLNPEFYLAV